MEEFLEAEILWPELDQEDYKKDCTRFQAHSGKARTQHNTPVPILSRPKDCVSRTWTAGVNYYRTCRQMHDDDEDDGDDDGDDYNGAANCETLSKDMVPPHVLVSRRYTGKMACPVCVGNGRTLKGRDLMVMRDSVLRLTGYLEK